MICIVNEFDPERGQIVILLFLDESQSRYLARKTTLTERNYYRLYYQIDLNVPAPYFLNYKSDQNNFCIFTPHWTYKDLKKHIKKLFFS